VARAERFVGELDAEGNPAKDWPFDCVFGPDTPTTKVSPTPSRPARSTERLRGPGPWGDGVV
jgi:hypothetical protein